METRKILICCLTLSVESPQPHPFAFCVSLPLQEDRVTLQEAEHHILQFPQPRIRRTGCLLSATQGWELSCFCRGSGKDFSSLAAACLMLTSLQGSPFLPRRDAEEYSCGVRDLVLVTQLKWRELEGKGCSSIQGVSQHVAVPACVTSVVFSLSPLPDFCLQKQSSEHFRTASEMRRGFAASTNPASCGGEEGCFYITPDLPLLTATLGGTRMLWKQFWYPLCEYFPSSTPPRTGVQIHMNK